MQPNLDERLASSFARLALAGVVREFPHKPDHLLVSAADARTPRQCHPVFYGCYDWHSAVHTHWLLARLWRRFPDLPEWPDIDYRLRAHFRHELLAVEQRYASEAQRISFERPYGWAWLFKLCQELVGAAEPARAWSAGLSPLADLFRQRLLAWLPRQRYPIRTGVHSNTALLLAFALDYARALGDAEMAEAVELAARHFYGGDRAAPARWEPCGNDFLSPSLVEADLMRRVLEPEAFAPWLALWLPDLAGGGFPRPVDVTDRDDPQGAHLDGLHLSRAWCLLGIASALGERHAWHADLMRARAAHLEAGLAHVESGNFLGEHWLASFALYALTE